MAEEIVGLCADVILALQIGCSATLNCHALYPYRLHLGVRSSPKRFRHEPSSSRRKDTAFTISNRQSREMARLSQQIAPGLRRVAVVHVQNRSERGFSAVVEAAAPQMGIAVSPAQIRNADDIERILWILDNRVWPHRDAERADSDGAAISLLVWRPASICRRSIRLASMLRAAV